jgi:hypothetical protein
VTVQAADYLIYKNEKYELLGDWSRQLPMLGKYGIEPVMMSTGCWRGYIAHYTVIDQQLFLTELAVNDTNDHFPEIGSVKPERDVSTGIYKNLREPMPITGRLVIGKKFASSTCPSFRYVHDYAIVLKLGFQAGMLQSIEDISAQAEVLRIEIELIKAERLKQRQSGIEPSYKKDEYESLIDQSFYLTRGVKI